MSRSASLPVALPALLAVTALGWSADAKATDGVHIEVNETQEVRDEDGEVVEVVETTEVHSHGDQTWGGLYLGTVVSPFRIMGPTNQNWRVTSDRAQACLDPAGARGCGNVRGFDARLVIFEADGKRDYPWAVGYFRSGYTGGRMNFNPTSSEGFAEGEARRLSYMTVPLFFGGNFYVFDDFPLRPYAGMGAGFDVLRIQYDRHEASSIADASVRIGFELHAGLEARITNYVSLSAEIQQLWSARRKIGGVPDFSNEGFSIVSGVTVSMPSFGDRRRKHHRVKTVRRVERVEPKRAPAPVPATLKAAAPPPAPTAPVAPEPPVAAPEAAPPATAPAAPLAPAAPEAPALEAAPFAETAPAPAAEVAPAPAPAPAAAE
ncbi:MAG: outer membrane protein [Nannocystales bacterium]